MSKLTLLLVIALLPICMFGQLSVNQDLTDEELVQSLVGPGVSISDIVITCGSESYGQFDGITSSLNLSTGIVLSSGSIANTVGPNNNGATSFTAGTPGDVDLGSLIAIPTYDACVLEFDAVATGDTLRFNYVFGSEEYLEFANTGFNDIFAFFISGPGITGIQNIAMVPGTGQAVSINNVNDINNPAYYVDNGNGSNEPFVSDSFYVQYDGLTVVLEAKSPVVPGETYHLKLAIADASDYIFDSGVFIETGSLRSEAVIDCSSAAQIGNLNASVSPSGTGVQLSWQQVAFADFYQVKGRKAGTTPFGTFVTANTSKNIGGLTPCTGYEWKVRARCPLSSEVTPFSDLNSFTTNCPALKTADLSGLRLSPNPVADMLRIQVSLESQGEYEATIIDVSGRELVRQTEVMGAGQNTFELNTSSLPAGFYILNLRGQELNSSQEFMKLD